MYLNYAKDDKFCRWCGHELIDIPGKEQVNTVTGEKEIPYIFRCCPVKKKVFFGLVEVNQCWEKSGEPN